MKDKQSSALVLALAAAALMALTMGSRSAFGLFLAPMNAQTAAGYAAISLAIAVAHLLSGLAQPFAGALAQRWGIARMIAGGCALLATAYLALASASGFGGLLLGLVMAALAGAAAGSNGILLGAVSAVAEARHRGPLLGVVGAGGSIGLLVMSPASQYLIDAGGYRCALLATALLALAAVPLARLFGRPVNVACPAAGEASAAGALRNREFWILASSFAMCGFHVTFLTSHMPGVIASCGLPAGIAGLWLGIVGLANVASSLLAGAAMQRIPAVRVLVLTYLARALGIVIFLAAPSSVAALMAFGAWMGLTYMATLPPTAGLLAERFGAPSLPKLLGTVMAIHQVGAFLGAWLGGMVFSASGDYLAMWAADLAMSMVAALLLGLGIRTQPACTVDSAAHLPALASATARS